MANLWVWIETFQNTIAAVSYEALGAARQLAGDMGGGTVTALLFGDDVAALAATLGERGADRVLACSDATLKNFRVEPFVALVVNLAREQAPDAILAGATNRGRDLMAGTAADLGAGLIADVIALSVSDGQIEATRPVYAGKLLATASSAGRSPILLTVRSRAFPATESQPGQSAEVVAVTPALAESDILTQVDEWLVEAAGQVSLTDARTIVSGGRGVSNNSLQPPAGLDAKAQEIWRAQEGFKMIGELAAVLGAAVGASRAAVDAGYIPYAHQVGQTGKTVSPDLYIACGISGAIQHQAGMRTAKNIVAINKAEDAPIFKLAQYGLVGDMFKIVPALTKELKTRLGQ